METILIVGGRVETLVKAKELGLRVLFMQHRDRMLPGHVETADALFMVDYTDWELIRPIVQLGGTSFEVARLFKNKLAMRRHLAGTDVPTVAAEHVESMTSVTAFGRRHGFPIVLKPIDNTASRGVQVIERAEEVERAWQVANALRDRDDLVLGQFFPVRRMLVEQYISGPEYSVETFSFGGRHSVVAITEKHGPDGRTPCASTHRFP